MRVTAVFRAIGISFAVVIGAGAYSGSAGAAENAPTPGQAANPAQSKLQALRKEIKRVRSELQEIEKATFAANPDLAQRRDNYRSLIQEKMEAGGTKPADTVARLKEIESKIKTDKGMSQGERKRLIGEYRKKGNELRKAQQSAMQDEEVQAVADELSTDTVAAMKKQDPRTEELLAELKQLRQEARQIMSDARRQPATGG